MARPATEYARSGDVNIAYQVFGAGEVDLVLVPGWVTHLEFGWQGPWYEAYLERLARFARVILFDKRGTGMSDRVAVGSLEDRMDDIRAVMDAVESRQAVLYAISEGGPLALLFAASHSDRVSALVVYGSFARMTAAPDYSIGVPSEQWREQTRFTEANWPVVRLDLWAPSLADNAAFQQWVAALRRHGASPGAARSLMQVIGDIDVRPALPVIDAPALVLHRRGDRTVPIEMGRVIADGLPNARWVELEGGDHFPWVGDVEALVGEIEQFATGRRVAAMPERVLATILFADIVDSTRRLAEVGDSRWRELLAAFHLIGAREIGRWKGRLLDTAGDGFFAAFDGPARAIRCATAVREEARQLGLEVRAGLHTGECERTDGKLAGLAVHIGARVAAVAMPGDVLVSSTVRDLVAGSDIEFAERGSSALKGVPGEWRLYAVTTA
jgi:class 3 adenylate cyclase